jgi:predicted nucleotidyltransferase component of viral defense system
MNIQNEVVHQTGNDNFYLGCTGPLGGIGTNKSLKADIANDEILCDDPVEKIVNNEYTDLDEEYKILSYTLDEIITEKMRSLMQRTMPRDLYDIFYLFEIENNDIEQYLFNLKKKA